MDQNFHLIEKYFQGKLDKDELQLFNQRLQKDSAFEQEFRDMKLIRDAVKETSRIKALDILQNAEANLSKKETTKINVSMKRLVSIAASLLIIATVSYFAISNGAGALTGEQVFDSYYEPYTNIVAGQERGATIELTTLNARAYNAYDIADYNTSADLFAELLKAEKNAENFLYSGIANLEAGNYEAAKNNLNTVMNNFSALQEQAQWYLAMTLFKEGSEDEAIANMASLAVTNSSSKFTRDAKDIFSKMNLTISKDEEIGEAEEPQTHPVGNHLPDRGEGELLGQRQTQFGKVKSLSNGKVYRFHNDYPIEGLKHGDLVTFVVIRAAKGKKPMAIILDTVE